MHTYSAQNILRSAICSTAGILQRQARPPTNSLTLFAFHVAAVRSVPAYIYNSRLLI